MDRWRRFQNRIEFGYEQHCLGTPNSGRSYARRAHASRSCPRSWMSPSVGSILGEQGPRLRWLRAVEHRDFETRKEKKKKIHLGFLSIFFSFLKSGPVHTA